MISSYQDFMFLNFEKAEYNDAIRPCHTSECIPFIRDENKLNTLSKILNNERWHTIVTHNMYGENDDPQKIWIFQTILKMFKSPLQAKKLHVFMHFTNQRRNNKNNIGEEEDSNIINIHINRQYKEMISSFSHISDVDLLKDSYNLTWDTIDYDQFGTMEYEQFLLYSNAGSKSI